MSDSDKSLNIAIRTSAELKGAQAAFDALEKDIAKAKLLGQEYVHLETRLKAVTASITEYRAAQAAQDVGQKELSSSVKNYTEKELEDVLSKTGKVVAEKGKLKELVSKLTTQFPALGSVMAGALGPASIIVAATTLAVGYLVGKYQQLQATMRMVGEEASRIKSDWIDAQKEALDAATVSARLFYHELARGQGLREQASQEANAHIAKIEKEASAQDKLRDAYKQYDEAVVDALQKSGKISTEQAIKLKLEIDTKYFDQQIKAQEEKAKRIVQTMTTERDSLAANGEHQRSVIEKTGKTFNEAEGRKLKFDEQLSQDKSNLEAEQAKLKKMQERQTDLEYKGFAKVPAEYKELQFLNGTIPSQQGVIQSLRKAIEKNEEKRPDVNTTYEQAKADHDAAKSEYQESQKRLTELQREIPQRRAELGFDARVDSTVSTLNRRTAAVRAGGEIQSARTADADAQLQSVMSGERQPRQVSQIKVPTTEIGNQANEIVTAINKLSGAYTGGLESVKATLNARLSEVERTVRSFDNRIQRAQTSADNR